MEMDLNSRNAKWKREQDRIKEQARIRQQAEKVRRVAAEKARLEMEAIQAQKRIERAMEQEQAAILALDEQRETGGIKYMHQLASIAMATDGDKITLPVSALETLNPQNAFDLGVFTFELSYTDEKGIKYKTHGGVLEFTAAEGTVGIPPKVASSLFRSGDVPSLIQVRFVRLEKGTFARLQPLGNGFGEREMDFKKILERSLKAHTTLTQGDVVFVRHGRETFEVKVIELRPEEAVNILNTDLEVVLDPCENIMNAKVRDKRQQEAIAQAKEREKRREELKLEQEKERERVKQEKMDALLPEPSNDEPSQVKILLRMPDGTRSTRRFRHESPLAAVFALIEALTGEDRECFQVVATYPRRLFGVDRMEKTLRELGFNGRQESFFVERIAITPVAVEDTEMEVAELDESPVPRRPLVLGASWEAAKKTLEKEMDETLYANISTPIHALEPILPVSQTTDRQTKWQAQLKELAVMGFLNQELNMELLDRYQGRLLRVVNYLSELTSDPSAEIVELTE